MAHDYYIPEYLRDRIALLGPSEKQTLDRCLDQLLRDPEPDGVTRRRAPPYFPYRRSAIVTECGGFSISYELVNQRMVVAVFAVSPLPDPPPGTDPY
jgi:hypothetical protein